jgi:predicted RNA-binding Zn ribbon-like protein
MVMVPYPTVAALPAFDLRGGHPALDLVNSLDNRFSPAGPTELLSDYGDVLRFAEQSQLLDAARARQLLRAATPAAAARALQRVRGLREALATTLYGLVEGRQPRAAELHTLEGYFRDAAAHRELRWPASRAAEARGPASWQWGRFEKDSELPVWALAGAAAELIVSAAIRHLRACGSDTCRWLFLDASKNHTRRWCNMKVCGNRMKARRFQERHGSSA